MNAASGPHAEPAADPALARDLAMANRILFSEGVVDALDRKSVV